MKVNLAVFKKFFFSAGLATSLTLVPLVSSAQAITNTATSSSATQQQRMASLKTRADNEIKRRITALNDLITKLGTMKKLSAESKAAFTKVIQTEISNLQILESKIDADTDLVTLKADVQSIVTEYRVFLLFIPQIQLLAAADRMSFVAGKLNDLVTKLQTRLNAASASGKDVTSLETLLKDMSAKIADAVTQYNNVESTVTPLTPQGYPGNRGVLTEARKMIQTGHLDLVAALQDAQKIVQGLKALNNTSTSSAH